MEAVLRRRLRRSRILAAGCGHVLASVCGRGNQVLSLHALAFWAEKHDTIALRSAATDTVELFASCVA